MNGKRLGVNVDHVATIRQARGTAYPDPVFAALLAERIGAHQITVHLREDRRHIQDRDLRILKDVVQVDLNLEMAATDEMVDIAVNTKPQRVTLVPEKREELTTEGGLDVAGQASRLKADVARLKSAGIVVSMFIEPDVCQVDACVDVGADAVEFHTGRYCDARDPAERSRHLDSLRHCAEYAARRKLAVAAGHGLDLSNVAAVAAIDAVEELNIGHSIIARAILLGLEDAVAEMLDALSGAGVSGGNAP